MLWFYGHLESIVVGAFAIGIVAHFLRRRVDRRRYLELRDEYEDAIREAREGHGAPPAIVREAELRRSFAEARMLGWFEGFGHSMARWAKVCAAFVLVALFLRGPILRGEADYARRNQRPVAASKLPVDSARR
ncbi:MAG: hypothetical protein WB493_06630 [Anaeromyxobacteraceae bacterium]|jgi:hypothetical protein